MIPIALSILGALAPHAGDIIGGIASMFGGPKAQEVAKSVVDKAQSVFGTTDPEQIKLLIAQDQGRVQKYVEEVRAQTEQYRIQVQDIQSARDRDIKIRALADSQGTPAGTNARANVMLVGSFICFIAIVLGIMFYRNTMPDGVLAILNVAVGALLQQMNQAFNFEFGSSRGSSEKSNTISEMAKK